MYLYSYLRRVQWSECDAAGVIFFGNYSWYVSDGLMQMFRTVGIDPVATVGEVMLGIPVLSIDLKFSAPAMLNDVIRHDVGVAALGTKSLDFAHRFTRGEQLLAEGRERRVWVEINRNTGELVPTPIPDAVRRGLTDTAPREDLEYKEFKNVS